MIRVENYVNGEWISSNTNQILKSINPANALNIVGEIQNSSVEEVEEALQAAKNSKKAWKKLGSYKRGEILYNVSIEIENNLNEIAETLTKEMGKTLEEAIGETKRSIAILKYFAAEGMRKEGDLIPASDNEALMITKREPLGVVGIITPWNFPVAIPIWKIAPALIYGNTVVFKPASESAVTASLLIKCFEKAGLPNGVLNFITGSGSVVGNALINSTLLDGISFTGSETTGDLVLAAATKNKTKVQLELGGKNPVIVLDDADLEKAANGVISGAFKSTGQKCTATSRVIVTANIYDAFKEVLLKKTATITVGDGLNSRTWMGPCASESQLYTVLDYIEIGKKEGAKLIFGGNRLTEDNYSNGYYIEPTIFEDVSPNMKIATEEIFGPVIALIKAQDINDAIELANNSMYGLSASIYTQNIQSALTFIDDMEAGLVRINAESAGVELQAPFGGMKSSSYGPREQGEAAKEFYTTTKTIFIKG